MYIGIKSYNKLKNIMNSMCLLFYLAFISINMTSPISCISLKLELNLEKDVHYAEKRI